MSIHNVVVVSGENTSVGKTTIAREVLRPGLAEIHGSCEFYQIEATDRVLQEGAIRITPDDLPELFSKLVVIRARKQSSITDIGGGQAEHFFKVLERNISARTRIDLFVLPLVPGLEETKVLSIIEKLVKFGADPAKLVVVFNKVNGDKDNALETLIKNSYPHLMEHSKRVGYRISNTYIPDAKVIAEHGSTPECTLYQTSEDKTDYAAEVERLASEGASDDEISECAKKEWRRDEAIIIADRIIEVFNDITCADKED